MDDALLVAILRLAFLAVLALFVVFTVRTIAVRMRPPASPRDPRAAKRPVPAADERGKRPNVVIVRTGGKRVGTVKLVDGLTLGRGDECELRPPDDYLSQTHARFNRRDGAWFIEDLGSTNGTKVNDRLLTGPLEVRAGDEIQAGTTRLELRR